MAASWTSFLVLSLLGSVIAHPFNDLSARAEAAWQKPAGHSISAPQCSLGPNEVAGTIAGGCSGGYKVDGLAHDCVCDLTASGSYYCLDTAFPMPLQHCETDAECPQGGACDITLGGICAQSKTCSSSGGGSKAATPSASQHTIDAPKCKLGANELATKAFAGGCAGSIMKDGVAHDCMCNQAVSGQYYCINEIIGVYPSEDPCTKDSDCPQGAICNVDLGNTCVKSSGCTSSSK